MSLCRIGAYILGKTRPELIHHGLRSLHLKGPRDAFLEMQPRLTGRVLDIGCGTGTVFDDYPPHIHVVGLDKDDELLQFARQGAERGPAHITMVAGDAETLCFCDDLFDATVIQFTLCSVSDPKLALSEIIRVVRPGGLLYIYEHVISQQRFYRFLQNLTAPIWKRITEGCHWNRDTMALVRAMPLELVRAMPLEIEKTENLILHRSPLPPMPIARVIARKRE